MSAENLLNSFLETTQDEGQFETEYKLCPELDAAPATVKKYDVKAGTYTNKQGEEAAWCNLTLTWDVDSQEAREAIGRDEVNVRQAIMLSFEKGTTKLSKTDNLALGRLLKIWDLDASGISLKDLLESLIGQYAVVKVAHRPMIGKDKAQLTDDEGNPRFAAEVVAVGKPA